VDPARIAAAAPILTLAGADNRGTGRISAGSVDAAFLAAPLAAPLTLGFDASSRSFNGFAPGTVVQVTAGGNTTRHTITDASDTVPFTPGATLRFGGMSVQFQGEPAHGDRFTVEPSTGAVSDGRNALLMGSLQSAKTLGGGTASFSQAFGQIVSQVGNKTRQVEVAHSAQSALSQQIRSAHLSVSGVNQDEETANLLMYQQMYQANAKVIQTAAAMFDAVLGISR
jgi:flagellar hook-associated protein 1 FlgK